MKKIHWIIIIVAAILLIGGATWYFVKKAKDKKEDENCNDCDIDPETVEIVVEIIRNILCQEMPRSVVVVLYDMLSLVTKKVHNKSSAHTSKEYKGNDLHIELTG